MKDLKEYLHAYKADVELVATKYSNGNRLTDALTKDIYADTKRLIDQYLVLGNNAHLKQDSDDIKVLFLSYRIRSEIAYDLKDLVILMRNIYVEALKAKAYRTDGSLTDVDFERFTSESQDVISQASQSLSASIAGVLSQVDNEVFINKDLMHYRLVESPWEVYQKQYREILNQMMELRRQLINYDDVKSAFSVINLQIVDTLESLKVQTDSLLDASKDLSSEYEKDQLAVDVINQKIENVESVSIYKETLKFKLEKIDSTIKNLKNYIFSVGYKDGNLIQKNINLSQLTSKWLELSLVPLLADMHDKLKILKTTSDISAKNMRNKLSLLTENNHDEFLSDLAISADKLNTEQQKLSQFISEKKVEVEALLEGHFKPSNIYTDKAFLSTDLQSSVNQIMRDQNRLVEVINNRFGQRQEELKYFFTNLQKKEKLTEAERIALALNSRSGRHATESYDQVFLRQNIFSEFYIIERLELQERAKESIQLWRSGYNGSLIITGAPLSGKTTFANHIVINDFSSNFIRLEPNSEQSFNGRKFSTEEGLGEALSEITKSRIVKPTCILIDDLELWHNDGSNLLRDARDLIDFNNKNSDMIYVVVSINPVALHFLNIYMDFSEHFLSVIDVSKAKFSYFRDIIQLRHTATQKTLVKSNGTEYNPDEFLKIVKQVYKNANGNLGDGLLRWASGSKEISSDQVIFEYTDFNIDNFITKDNEVLIEQFFKYKKLTDTELISIFTKEQYESVRIQLKSLLRNKILVRDNDGYIQINDLIITEAHKFYVERFSPMKNIYS